MFQAETRQVERLTQLRRIRDQMRSMVGGVQPCAAPRLSRIHAKRVAVLAGQPLGGALQRRHFVRGIAGDSRGFAWPNPLRGQHSAARTQQIEPLPNQGTAGGGIEEGQKGVRADQVESRGITVIQDVGLHGADAEAGQIGVLPAQRQRRSALIQHGDVQFRRVRQAGGDARQHAGVGGAGHQDTARAAGDRAKVPEPISGVLAGTTELTALDARLVQPYYAKQLARSAGLSLSMDMDEADVVVKAA